MKPSTASLLAIAGGTFMVIFNGAAVQMALPVLQRDLGAPLYEVQWTMTAFLLVSTAALLPAGRAGDVYGRARAWRAGALVFVIASALCAVVPGLWWLVVVRAVQGLGAALTAANAAPLLVEAFPPEHRGRALGAGNLAIALGLVLGPPVGSLLMAAVSWRLIFVVAVPVGLWAWLGSRGPLPRHRGAAEPLGAGGGLLSFVALVALLLPGTFGRGWGWGSPLTLLLFGAGALFSLAFAVQQARARRPLLDLKLLRDRMFVSGAITSLMAFAALFSLTVVMPFFLVVTQGRSIVQAGLLVGFMPLGLSVAAPLAGWASDAFGSRTICTAGLIAIAGAFVLMQWAGPGTSAWLLAPVLLLAGAGLGAFEAPNDVAVLGAVPPERLGVGTAMLGAMRNLGMTFGGAVAATILDYELSRAGATRAARAAEGAQAALLVGAVFAGLGAIAAALRPGGAAARGRAGARLPAPDPGAAT
ncbi:MAG TPA: MFS transporter [Polyangia bacterium]